MGKASKVKTNKPKLNLSQKFGPLLTHGCEAFVQSQVLKKRNGDNFGGGASAGGSSSRGGDMGGGDMSFGLKDWFKNQQKTGPAKVNFIMMVYTRISFYVHILMGATLYMNKNVTSPITCIGSSFDPAYAEQFCANNGLYYWQHSSIPKVPIPNIYKVVGILQFFQAWLFRVPYFLWTQLEGGTLHQHWKLLSDIRMESEKDEEKLDFVIHKAVENFTIMFGRRTMYLVQCIMCEIVALGILVIEFYVTSAWLDTDFLSYGFLLIDTDPIMKLPGFYEAIKDKPAGHKYDPAQPVERITAQNIKIGNIPNVFPVTTRCIYNQVGVAGSEEQREGLCQLSTNTLSEIAHVALWFWLIALTVGVILNLSYHFILLIPSGRIRTMIFNFNTSQMCDWARVRLVMDRASAGDVVLLMRMKGSVPDFIFVQYINFLAKRIGTGQRRDTKKPHSA